MNNKTTKEVATQGVTASKNGSANGHAVVEPPKVQEVAKPVVSGLEKTIEIIIGIGHHIKRRVFLKGTLADLDRFKIENDKDGGQSLKIKDAQANFFETTDPVLIEAVVQCLKGKTQEMIAETEAHIVLV